MWPSQDYIIRVAEDRSKGALDIYSVFLDKCWFQSTVQAKSPKVGE